IVIPPAIFFYYSTLFDSRFKTLQQNSFHQLIGLAKQEEIKNQVLLLEGELISRDSVHKIK
ncbi:hypothetical protein M4I68_08680, partial [Enterococcus faecium]|nr:hypothetical protein [Enterococcus faecium]